MEKLLPIINLVLTVVAIVVCVITLLSVNGIKGELANLATASQGDSQVSGDIPLTQQTLYNMEKQFIFTYPPREGEKKTTSVVVNIGFILNNEEKDAADVLAQFAEKQGLVRDRIQTMVKERSDNPFASVELQRELKGEILTLVRKLFETNSIIDVVFTDVLSSQK
ncbi:hypothetical protein C3V36_13415 [Lachnospiraceae bacterium oral taxon 500]|nr:hypothetical protein C3V36_13415 [Lachnospiraceae bacterium oral taxon 500]